MQKPIIFSVGHSNKPIGVFLGKLKEHRIDHLVDVRTIPSSRFCPHFNKNALQATLSIQTIKYLWKGENLGGKGINVGYEEAIDELVGMAQEGTKIAVLCSEGDYRKCHRYTALTPSFEQRGVRVFHIEYENETTKRNK